MASIQKRGERFQLRVKHKLLPRPFFFTFDTEDEARTYGSQLEALLKRGIVPQELLVKPQPVDDPLLTRVASDYSSQFPVTRSDSALLSVVLPEIVGVRLSGVTYRWVEQYVAELKRKRNLAPGTIRKRVGLLGRVFDWHARRVHSSGAAVANPFRLLPAGYSTYSREDSALVTPKQDVQRDRRLSEEEAERILAALGGKKRIDRERRFTDDAAFGLLYRLIVDTGLRLFEAYRLTVDRIDLQYNVIRVEGSKGARGARKPRVVPIKVLLREPLRAWCEGRSALVFPYWDGTEEGRPGATGRLSQRFRGLFTYAEVDDFTEHDLRHEAACRWFELRHHDGRWVFSDIEICRIMGWTDPRMALRYASLRGEDLSSRLG